MVFVVFILMVVLMFFFRRLLFLCLSCFLLRRRCRFFSNILRRSVIMLLSVFVGWDLLFVMCLILCFIFGWILRGCLVWFWMGWIFFRCVLRRRWLLFWGFFLIWIWWGGGICLIVCVIILCGFCMGLRWMCWRWGVMGLRGWWISLRSWLVILIISKGL